MKLQPDPIHAIPVDRYLLETYFATSEKQLGKDCVYHSIEAV